MNAPAPIENIISAGTGLADKWGASACIFAAVTAFLCFCAYQGAPVVWNDLMDTRRKEIELQQSALAAITMRLEVGNDKLSSIHEVLEKNNEDMTAGFNYTTKKLEEIASATGRMSQGRPPANPLADMPPLMIPPSFSFCPKPEKTPNT